VIKWKKPEREFSFFYANNDQYKHIINCEIAKMVSDKRVTALKKLYFDYQNKETFRVNQLLENAITMTKDDMVKVK
jgi:hypothetical protein